MRTILMLTAIAAITLLPGALALEQVVVAAPDAQVGVQGRTLTLDTTKTTGAGPGVAASFSVRDVDVSYNGAKCMVDPRDEELEVKGSAPAACDTGSVSTTASPDVVQADVDLLLPAAGAPVQDDAEPSALATAIAAAGPDAPPALLAAAAAGASMLSLYGIWRVLKWTGLAAAIPLYSHIRDDEILDDPNRAGIYRLIQAEPGISTKDVADRLDLAWGTVTHHLGKLEKRRFVVSKKYGKYRRYFSNGEGGTQEKDTLAVLRLDRTGDVAALIRAQPGVTQKAVSEALGVSSSTILWHVKRLEEVRLVTKVRDGKLVRYFPAEGGAGTTLIAAVPTTAA